MSQVRIEGRECGEECRSARPEVKTVLRCDNVDACAMAGNGVGVGVL
jgi:hypothetical protein